MLALNQYAREMTPEISESMKIVSGILQDRIVKGKELSFPEYQESYARVYKLCIMVPMGEEAHFIETWMKEMYKSMILSIRLLKNIERVKKDYDFISTAFAYPIRLSRAFPKVEFLSLVNLRSGRMDQFDKIKPFLMDFGLLGDVSIILTQFFIRLAVPR